MKGYSDSYNNAGSSSVGQVDKINVINNQHKIPVKGEPNSVVKSYQNGKLDSERYFDKNGKPYLDIDYTNHGNSKLHPRVPHEHKISIGKDGKINRKKEEKINK